MLGFEVKQPNFGRPHSLTIHAGAIESLGVSPRNLNPASTVWPTANKAIIIPFRLHTLTRFRSLRVATGAAASGNFDIGIYDKDGNRLFSTGSTAHSGTAQAQAVTQTFDLGPGSYYKALAFDNTTAAVYSKVPANIGQVKQLGVAMMTSAFPLPSTLTLAAAVDINIPIFGPSQAGAI